MTENSEPIYLKIPKDVKEKFKKMAKGTTMTELFITWINHYYRQTKH